MSWIVAVALNLGCDSYATYAQSRRDGMLAAYPPGKTMRSDVRRRWGGTPDLSLSRPDGGWAAAPASVAGIARRAVGSEHRTGRMVASVERYSGPDTGTSSLLSLCHGWFFYDASDRVVDVEWEYMSD